MLQHRNCSIAKSGSSSPQSIAPPNPAVL
jgi:hypothetical protein